MMTTESQGYRELQKHLDTLPIGFPPAESGVEIRLLQHFFTPEEARVATCLTITPETAATIHERVRKTGMSRVQLQKTLASLERKVCITTSAEGGEKLYRNSPFVVGIWESAVNH